MLHMLCATFGRYHYYFAMNCAKAVVVIFINRLVLFLQRFRIPMTTVTVTGNSMEDLCTVNIPFLSSLVC